MASPDEVFSVLQLLLDYYNYRLTKEALHVYVRMLRSLDGDLLKQAAERWILKSRYFPRVNELWETAREIPPLEVDYLALEIEHRKRRFLEGGELDVGAWEKVARLYERSDDAELAFWVRDTLQHLQRDCNEDGTTHASTRQRYLEWETAEWVELA